MSKFQVTETEISEPANDDLSVALHDALNRLIGMTKELGGGAVHIQSETDDETREFRVTLCDFTGAKTCGHCAGTGIAGSADA